MKETSATQGTVLPKNKRKTRYTHLPRDNGVNGSPSVADHEYELGVGEEVEHVGAHLEGERVLVAESWRWLAVPRDHLQAKRRYGTVHHLWNEHIRYVIAGIDRNCRASNYIPPQLDVYRSS